MIAPDLEAFVAAELGKEGAVLKERRKLREEQRLVRAQPKPNAIAGKGAGRGDGAGGAP